MGVLRITTLLRILKYTIKVFFPIYTMLCLYLDTLIIGHKLRSMLSILNELTLPKFMTNNVF